MKPCLWIGEIVSFDSENDVLLRIFQATGIRPVSCWFQADRSQDISGRKKDGYGFVEFRSMEDATQALSLLSTSSFIGKDGQNHKFKVNWASNTPHASSSTKSTYSAYIGNLPFNMTDDGLLSFLRSRYPNTLSVSLKYDNHTHDFKGFAFAEYRTYQEVRDVISSLNGCDAFGKPIIVREATNNRIQTKSKSATSPAMSNALTISNLDRNVREETLKQHFAPYGTVISVYIPDDKPGWASVVMENTPEAELALHALQGAKFGGSMQTMIEFGRVLENPKLKKEKVTISAPQIMIGKKHKNKALEKLFEPIAPRVMQMIQRTAEIDRPHPLAYANPKLENSRSASAQIDLSRQPYFSTLDSQTGYQTKYWYYH